MKIIEALKKIKDLQRKASDLRDKIGDHCAKMSFEDDPYDSPREKISSWLQAHHDIVLEIERLRESVAHTNIATLVEMEIGGKLITKSIHSWISRRRDLVALDYEAWSNLSDKGLRDQLVRGTNAGKDVVEFKVVRFFDPEERDRNIEVYRSERSLIDAKLEVVNATTDLIK